MAKKRSGDSKRRRSGRRKVRVDIRRNKQTRPRRQNLTQDMLTDADSAADAENTERLSGKGHLSRRRTIITDAENDESFCVTDVNGCLNGRVLSFTGLNCIVQSDSDGRKFECTLRGVLRTMARESRNAVVTGDRVRFRPEGDVYQGVIEQVEPRHGTLARHSQGKEHVLVANIDQILIVASAASPELKTNLIDRYLVNAEVNEIPAVVCINKVDLVDINVLQSVTSLYSRLGYRIVLTSAVNGHGIDELRTLLSHRETAVSGQSGVGKSSLLNTVDHSLNLETSDISNWSQKGRHTTRRTHLLPLESGGWVADTPGIRQFTLWDLGLEEIDGFFAEFRSFIPYCRFPDCSHIHEQQCGVKDAAADGLIAQIRYDSYVRMREEDAAHRKAPPSDPLT
ncbi:MAG: ribosome small subunit-dependent GTPase A [Fuerstiella sp.]|nr:ribosome small subunit-dependent GTPase A [Fuerstiella sp.]